jgi:hypothetical protein
MKSTLGEKKIKKFPTSFVDKVTKFVPKNQLEILQL